MSGVPGNSEPVPHRLDALTGIRGFAAWFVVFYHIRFSTETIMPESIISLASKGYLAVDLFFVLSGFVLWFTYGERLRTGSMDERLVFMWRRIARVWPLHIFILMGFVVFAGLLWLTGRPTDGYPVRELPLHFFLIQNWGLTSELTWNDPAWSISTELAAYLAFPFVLVAARWDRMSTAALLGLVVALAASIALVFTAAGVQHDLGLMVAKLGLWRCLAEFWMGNVACILWLRWRDSRRAGVVVAFVAAAMLAIGSLAELPESAFVPLLFFTTILALALAKGPVSRALSTRQAVYLGEISYSTYLSHFGLFVVFKLFFVDESLQIGWAGLAGYFALLLIVSVALYHGVEKPAQRYLNRFTPRIRSAVPAE